MLARTVTIHPIADEYADFTETELAEMRKSLVECGLITPIVVWHGQIVDGRHREKLCRELNIEPRYDDVSTVCPTEDAMRKRVTALNQHRRARTAPLTNEEKRMRVAEELKTDPARSDREIAKAAGVHGETVAAVRNKVPEFGTNTSTGTQPDAKRERVEAELQTNPNRSDREIGRAAGVSKDLVKKVRAGASVASLNEAKGARAEAELLADPNRSNREIAKVANVSAELVTTVRVRMFGKTTPDFVEKPRTGKRPGVPVPQGKTLTALYREVMDMEATGSTAEEACRKSGVGVENYRRGRDILRLADNPRLTAEDAARVNAAVVALDERKSPASACEEISDILASVWGASGQGKPRDVKRERRLFDVYMSTLAVLGEAAEQAKIANVPYLDAEVRKSALSELEGAAKAIKKAIANLRGD